MTTEYDNKDTSSNIDEDEEFVSSDIEDDNIEIVKSPISKKKSKKKSNEDDEDEDDNDEDDNDEDDDDDDNEDEENEDGEIPIPSIFKRKLHQIKFNSTEGSKIIVVKPENRITSDHMTLYEYTSVVGTRATHIAHGSSIYTSYENLSDPCDIAKKEIDENRCPLSIVRKLGNSNKIEIWEVNELIKPHI